MASIAKIHTKDAVKKLTLNVSLTGVKSFYFRLAAGVALIKLAARIIGCGIKIDTGNEDEKTRPA